MVAAATLGAVVPRASLADPSDQERPKDPVSSEKAAPETKAAPEKPAATAEAEAKAPSPLAKIAPVIGMGYRRALAGTGSSDFFHRWSMSGRVDYFARDDLSIFASVAVLRDLDAAIREFRLTNLTLGATKLDKISIGDVPLGVLYSTLYGQLPTDANMRRYQSFRGTLGADLTLRNTRIFTPGKDHAFGASLGGGVWRNFYQYDASIEGSVNKTWQGSMAAAVFYNFQRRLAVIQSFSNAWGARNGLFAPIRDDRFYTLSTTVRYQPVKQLWLGLSYVNFGRLFDDDQTTPRLKLYSPETTQVLFTVSFLPKLTSTNDPTF